MGHRERRCPYCDRSGCSGSCGRSDLIRQVLRLKARIRDLEEGERRLEIEVDRLGAEKNGLLAQLREGERDAA